jgi:pseudouridine-5'-phosphate glycosidase
MNTDIVFSPEVKEALSKSLPVVALESTIIAHGMPFPKNLETARAVEQIVRDNGAVPATIAILGGKMYAGLEPSQLTHLAQAKEVAKVSLRDMPYIIAEKKDGATTVAATMRIASMAGIRLFVTGGIGGVHRGADKSMDVSADLTEMAQTDVAVVSAGVKSILDIGMTLEKLETLGVPVITYGNDEFPSFYSRQSGYASPLRMDEPEAVSKLLAVKWKMGLQGAVLIANPVPAAHEIPFAVMEAHIQQALAAADQCGVKGKAITPFLLKYLADQTSGESLEANIQLVKNNAALGARIAVAFANLSSR